MANPSPQELQNIIDRMAARFDDEKIPFPDQPEYVGWGQFLDVSRRNNQLGPYGTCAGLIVLSLANKIDSTFSNAQNLLKHWWDIRTDDHISGSKFCQTLRASSLLLALRLSIEQDGNPRDEIIVFYDEVSRCVFNSRLPSNLWGNYWFSDTIHDEHPKPFPSSLAILALSLLSTNIGALAQSIPEASTTLENRVTSKPFLPPVTESVAITAILSTKSDTLNKISLKKAKGIALNKIPDISSRERYFFDFDYGDRILRDYYFIPTAVVQGLAGFLSNAPTALRLFGENVLRLIVKNLRENNGLYKAPQSEDDRISTFDQAWVAIFLKVASLADSPKKDFFGSLNYRVRRTREDTKWTDLLGSFLYLSVVGIAAFTPTDTVWPGILSIDKFVIAISVVLASHFGGLDFLKRLISRIRGTNE